MSISIHKPPFKARKKSNVRNIHRSCVLLLDHWKVSLTPTSSLHRYPEADTLRYCYHSRWIRCLTMKRIKFSSFLNHPHEWFGNFFFSFFYSRELLFTENDKLGVSSDNRVELQLITQQYFHNWNTNNHITNLKEVKKDSEISTNWNLLGCLSHPQLWKSALTVAEN